MFEIVRGRPHHALMPILRFWLKYLPVGALGVLVVTRGLSIYSVAGCLFVTPSGVCEIWLADGNWKWSYEPSPARPAYVYYEHNHRVHYPRDVVGRFWLRATSTPNGVELDIHLPLLTLTTLALPAAIGPLVRFRFRLSHGLAYSGLFAVQLGFQSQADNFPFRSDELGWITAFFAALATALIYFCRRHRQPPGRQIDSVH